MPIFCIAPVADPEGTDRMHSPPPSTRHHTDIDIQREIFFITVQLRHLYNNVHKMSFRKHHFSKQKLANIQWLCISNSKGRRNPRKPY